MTGTPTRIDLIRQANSVREYLALCREHGIEPDGPPEVLGPTGLPGGSLGEQQHPAEQCDLDGRPHLGPCVEPGTRTDGTFVADEWPDQPAVDADTAAALKPGDPLRVVLDTGEEHHLVVTSDPQVDADGTVRFEAADPDRVAAMERLGELGARFAMHVPDGGIPNGHGGWLHPGPEPSDEQPGDLSGWTDMGYIDEDPVAPALGLEPHHAAARLRTDEERRALAPKMATGGVVRSGVTGDEPPPWSGEGCCRAANYSDGFAHDHAVVPR